MKKIIATILAVFAIIPCCLMLTGCGTTGTYKVEDNYVGATVSMTRKEFNKTYGDKFDYANASAVDKVTAIAVASHFSLTVTLEKDGVVKVGYEYPKWVPEADREKSEESKITWKKEDGAINFYIGEVKTDLMTIKDGKISYLGKTLSK